MKLSSGAHHRSTRNSASTSDVKSRATPSTSRRRARHAGSNQSLRLGRGLQSRNLDHDAGGANEAAGFHFEATGFGFHFLALARRDVFFYIATGLRRRRRRREGGSETTGGGLDASGDGVATTVSEVVQAAVGIFGW